MCVCMGGIGVKVTVRFRCRKVLITCSNDYISVLTRLVKQVMCLCVSYKASATGV